MMEMDQAESTDPSFLREITGRTLSCLAAQAYNRLGVFIGPIISGLKILVSKSTDLATNQQLDKPKIDLKPEFVDTCAKFLQNLPKLKVITPFPKE